MASAGVMPWLVGLPTSDVDWETTTPNGDNMAPASPIESVHSEPSGIQHVASGPPSGNYDTVAMRSRSASPKRQPTLEWKKRLVRGQLGYGDRTDLFGPSALENMFVRPQDADSSSQKKQQTKMAPKPKYTTNWASSPPVATATGDDDISPRSSVSSSSIESKLSELLERANEQNQRMQAVKERLNAFGCEERMELISTLKMSDKKRVSAETDFLVYKVKAEKSQHELIKAQRKLFDFTKKSLEAEHRADKAKSEMRHLRTLSDESEGVSRKAREEMRKAQSRAYELEEKYENLKAEVDCLKSENGYDSECAEEYDEGVDDDKDENNDPSEGQGSVRMSPSRLQYIKQAEAGAEHDEHARKQSNNYLAPPVPEHLEGMGSRTISDSELEDLTPVFVSKRTSSNGRVTYNAMRNNIIQQRKDIDKTDTSQRARELALAIGIDTPEDNIEGSGLMGLRHISGFTDAPEVETDMPMPIHKPTEDPVEWDFSEPPFNESSELAAAHNHGVKRMVSFGETELNNRAFEIVDAEFPSNFSITRDSDTEQSSRRSSKSGISTSKVKKLALNKTRPSPPHINAETASAKIAMPVDWLSPPKVTVSDADKDSHTVVVAEAKRPPTSPFRSPTPKRRRTLHDSELQSVTDANNSFHSQLQSVLTRKKPAKALPVEIKTDAKPEILAKRKMARPRNATPNQGPATKDYINEAKKVIDYLRGNNPTSSPLSGIAESAEGESYQAAAEEDFYNTHKSSDNMKTLGPQAVAHLIGGEVKGMTFDQDKNCWIRSKSSEHKQFLGPRDALSSDDDPFREISDLTVVQSPKLPGDDSTMAHYDEVHDSDPSQEFTNSTSAKVVDASIQLDDTNAPEVVGYSEMSARGAGDSEYLLGPQKGQVQFADESQSTNDSTRTRVVDVSVLAQSPAAEVVDYADLRKRELADINNTFIMSDLPEFTVNGSDPVTASEQALAIRLASYSAGEVNDKYALATKDLVRAVTDVHGHELHWEDLTTLALPHKALMSLHGLDVHCARVEKLDVSNNALTHLDGIPTFVRQLDVSSNKLFSLTSWGHLMHLQYLNLAGNGLDNLDGLGHLIHLRELCLDNNRIRSLDGIADLDGLITLSVKSNRVAKLDFQHYRLERLEELNAEGNNISTVNRLELLPSLKKLILDNNSMLEKVDAGDVMPNLEHLSIRHCVMNSLRVTSFPNLRSLEVDNNSLSSIDGLSSLKKLELISMIDQYGLEDGIFIDILNHPLEAHTVRLSKNKLPSDLDLPHILMSVKHLELHNTGLISLPDDLGVKLPNLRTLNVNFNAIRDIRPLAACQHLEVLSATNCRIERLRKTVATLGKLEKLKSVDLRHNILTQGFYGESQKEDEVYRSKLDEDTSISRRTYEMLIAYATGRREGLVVDELELDHVRAVKKDFVWERLMELGVLQRAQK